jgi:hypothetical protein
MASISNYTLFVLLFLFGAGFLATTAEAVVVGTSFSLLGFTEVSSADFILF